MTRRRLLAVTMAMTVAVAACGGDDPTLSSQARTDLSDRVDLIRAAAASGDRDAARFMLVGLQARVADLERSEQISDDQRARILAAAAEVDDALDLVPTTTTTTLPVDDDDDDGPGKGEGKGKGKDKD